MFEFNKEQLEWKSKLEKWGFKFVDCIGIGKIDDAVICAQFDSNCLGYITVRVGEVPLWWSNCQGYDILSFISAYELELRRRANAPTIDP